MQTLEEYAGGSLQEVVTNYEWRPADSDGRSYNVLIRIKVHKTSEGGFRASPSHRIKSPGQHLPYMPGGPSQETVEEAVRYCIKGFKTFIGSADTTTWHEATDLEV